MFAFQDARDRVAVAFTDRHGGVSRGEYGALNLGFSGDEETAVRENLRRVTDAFTGRSSAAVVLMRQVHGADVCVVDAGNRDKVTANPPQADALVTAVPGTVLVARVADCVPVVLADPERAVVGVAHAGRAGMAAGVVPKAVQALRGLGARGLVAWLGPHVCGRCYEVPEPMRAEVAAAVPESYAETRHGTPALDVGAGVRAQLAAAAVEVVDATRCTVEHDDLFSYRRQGPSSGRMAGLVWVRP